VGIAWDALGLVCFSIEAAALAGNNQPHLKVEAQQQLALVS